MVHHNAPYDNYTTAYEESNHAKRNTDEIYYINIIVSDCVTEVWH